MNILQEWANTITTSVVSAGAAFLFARRKFSKDSAGIAHDKGESNLIATLIAERDAANSNAREAWAQRVEDAKRIARFEALMEAAERETKRLRDELFSLRLHTRKLTTIIIRLDPNAAQLLELKQSAGDGIDMEDRRIGEPFPDQHP